MAVAALNKKNARVGPEALLLAGQRVEASGGRLGETRAIVKPANPQAHEPVPKQKAELEKKLKTLTAEAEARHDADASAAASAALHSGDSSRMSAVVAALKSAQDMSQEQRSLLVKAFDKGRSLNDFDSSSVQADSSEMRRRQMSRAMANWNVNRELGFQFHDQASRSLMAKGALRSPWRLISSSTRRATSAARKP